MSLSRWLPALRHRLRAFFERGRLERELDSELRFHLDQQTAENVERGLPPGEARRRALARMARSALYPHSGLDK